MGFERQFVHKSFFGGKRRGRIFCPRGSEGKLNVALFRPAQNEVREARHALELPDGFTRRYTREFLPVGERNVARLEFRRDRNVGQIFAVFYQAVVLCVLRRKRNVDTRALRVEFDFVVARSENAQATQHKFARVFELADSGRGGQFGHRNKRRRRVERIGINRPAVLAKRQIRAERNRADCVVDCRSKRPLHPLAARYAGDDCAVVDLRQPRALDERKLLKKRVGV